MNDELQYKSKQYIDLLDNLVDELPKTVYAILVIKTNGEAQIHLEGDKIALYGSEEAAKLKASELGYVDFNYASDNKKQFVEIAEFKFSRILNKK